MQKMAEQEVVLCLHGGGGEPMSTLSRRGEDDGGWGVVVVGEGVIWAGGGRLGRESRLRDHGDDDRLWV